MRSKISLVKVGVGSPAVAPLVHDRMAPGWVSRLGRPVFCFVLWERRTVPELDFPGNNRTSIAKMSFTIEGLGLPADIIIMSEFRNGNLPPAFILHLLDHTPIFGRTPITILLQACIKVHPGCTVGVGCLAHLKGNELV